MLICFAELCTDKERVPVCFTNWNGMNPLCAMAKKTPSNTNTPVFFLSSSPCSHPCGNGAGTIRTQLPGAAGQHSAGERERLLRPSSCCCPQVHVGQRCSVIQSHIRLHRTGQSAGRGCASEASSLQLVPAHHSALGWYLVLGDLKGAL